MKKYFSRFPGHAPSAGPGRFKCNVAHFSVDIVCLPTIQFGHGLGLEELIDCTLGVGGDEKLSPPANVKSIDTTIHKLNNQINKV